MRESGEYMIKVCTINNDFIICDAIKSNIPFNISEKLIELYVDWDYKKNLFMTISIINVIYILLLLLILKIILTI